NHDKRESRRLFHYTTKSRLIKIFETLEIRPTAIGVPKYEKPVVWLTYRQHWEPTATPMYPGRPLYQLTFEELCKLDTPMRIEIDPRAAPLDWPKWCNLSGVDRPVAAALKSVAEKKGARVDDWRMSFDPVRSADENWLAVEEFADGQWRDAMAE